MNRTLAVSLVVTMAAMSSCKKRSPAFSDVANAATTNANQTYKCKLIEISTGNAQVENKFDVSTAEMNSQTGGVLGYAGQQTTGRYKAQVTANVADNIGSLRLSISGSDNRSSNSSTRGFPDYISLSTEDDSSGGNYSLLECGRTGTQWASNIDAR